METTNETGTTPNDNGSGKPSLAEKYGRQRYGAPTKPAQSAPTLSAEDTDAPEDGSYRGLVKYRGSRGGPRFRIVNRSGVSYGCGYAYMLGTLFTPPDTLSIQTTTHLFTIAGTNMKQIEDALLREMVMELREFNPGQDAKPPTDAPIITHMEVKDRFKEKAI